MKIVLKYGDHLEVFSSVAEANKWLGGGMATFRNDPPDEAWEEDDECEVIREFVVLRGRLVEG